MKNKLFIIKIVIILFICLNTNAQPPQIIYKIKNKSLECVNDSGYVNILLKNHSSKRYILYGFKSLENSIGNIGFYTQEEWAISSAVIIEKNERQLFAVVPNISYHDVLELYADKTNIFKEQQVVLEPHSKTKLTSTFNLKEFYLKPGEYTFYLVYTLGVNSKNLVPEHIQHEDMQELKAEVFYGWIISNKVNLIVK